MKFSLSVAAVALLPLLAACANLDRSRDLANPAVAPAVTAAQVCALCHGLDGNSVSPNFPRLAGQQRDYFVAQMAGFRSHGRLDPAGFEYMWGLSRQLTDAQIQGLADYFAKQTPTANATVDAQQMARGKAVFEQGVAAKEVPPCLSCHGAQAQGQAAFPRLAGQHRDYLVKQLQVFERNDERPNTPMTQIAHALTHEQMEDVAGYLQTMP
jgi:cytochrome c553